MFTEIQEKIQKLKAQKNAVILAHYYAPDEAQQLADYVGDSFYLAKVAKESEADILVFCGVSFMGESAKLLNPAKKVLMPELSADCPMAHMVAPGRIAQMREQYEDLAVVCYINSTAALKAESDVCVTSSNAVRIVRALPNKNIFFIPDRNLGRFVAEQVPEKNVILNDGCCPIHAVIDVGEVEALRAAYPDAKLLAHPECEPPVLALADFIGSTAEIIAVSKESEAKRLIICTEEGVAYRLQSDSPEKEFYFPKTRPVCHDMKLNTAERILAVLEAEDKAVEITEEQRLQALAPLEKMLELAKK